MVSDWNAGQGSLLCVDTVHCIEACNIQNVLTGGAHASCFLHLPLEGMQTLHKATSSAQGCHMYSNAHLHVSLQICAQATRQQGSCACARGQRAQVCAVGARAAPFPSPFSCCLPAGRAPAQLCAPQLTAPFGGRLAAAPN
eukprot:scaffold71705_cov14-Tisochrysis_lutea.AAC.1